MKHTKEELMQMTLEEVKAIHDEAWATTKLAHTIMDYKRFENSL